MIKYSGSWSTLNEQNNSPESMVYIHAYGVPIFQDFGWCVIFGVSLTPKQREVLHWREKCDIDLWIQTWSNLENVTIISLYFTTLQHTTIFKLTII